MLSLGMANHGATDTDESWTPKSLSAARPGRRHRVRAWQSFDWSIQLHSGNPRSTGKIREWRRVEKSGEEWGRRGREYDV